MPARLTQLLIVFLLVFAAFAAEAKVVVVQPGPRTPFQDAIDAAAPGDTLRVAAGTYSEGSPVTAVTNAAST